MAEKLMIRILSALDEGADTSNEIAEMIDHPVANVSATLSEMLDSGIIRKTGRYRRISRGNRSFCYERTVAISAGGSAHD